MRRRLLFGLGSFAFAGLLTGTVSGWAQSTPTAIEIPRNATALEGIPQVRIETTREGALRRELDATEAVGSRLSITIKDGRFFWAGRDGRPLTVTTTQDYTYLSSTEPGTYVRFTELGNRLLYVEHLDMPFGSVTFWGEARVVFGK